ncbi:ABC transporter substrate-binding protein [Nocardioides sp. MAHUQ-72]|uniref:ABC transporter substrate-binding protein n=1 Tax=unclassified Nocardioides TaxID=2615069 RepID=UPI00361E75FE
MKVLRRSAGAVLDGRSRRGGGRRTAAALTAAALALALAGCDSGGAQPGPTLRSESKSTTPTPRTALSFGVYGPRDEVAALQGVVDTFNASSEGSKVTLHSWADHDAMVSDLRSAGSGSTELPDVFMVSRSDLAWLQEDGLTQPVDEMLDERGVDFGDGYSRDALQAFSADNRLQCMPYAISPMVIYYNTRIVDFARMRDKGLDAPDPEGTNGRWTFDQFEAAAKFASRPRKGTRGVHIDPTLRGLAPFIYSGGGQVFDDEETPTSLAFSDGDTRAALERTLEVLRDPHLTLTGEQLAKAPALTWFERGKLGMIAGFRSLVPELRQVPGLQFDVLPMPALGGSATVGDITGLCVSADSVSTPEAADFLVRVLSTASVNRVAQTGYIVPANLEAAASDSFLQPSRQPAHPAVFNSSVRSVHLPPLIDHGPELESAVADSLDELFTVPVLDLDAITEQIDEESRKVLDPESGSESPDAG